MISKLQVWCAFLGDHYNTCWEACRGIRFVTSLWWSDMSYVAPKADGKSLTPYSSSLLICEGLKQQISDKSGCSWASMPLLLTLISWGQALQDISAIACQLHTEKEEDTLYTSTLKKVKNVFSHFSDVHILIKYYNILPIFFFLLQSLFSFCMKKGFFQVPWLKSSYSSLPSVLVQWNFRRLSS